ncbi:hypothetical protein JB92DRAFT_2835904 [Gautieria morchelliformis]|nr:hypothetical protein JB92DRAFT_2835904 [Gautieria morchelliformis]
MLNKQLCFVDGLERLAEGKSLDGNGKGLLEDNLKPYNVHLWIMSLESPNSPSKELRIQAVTPALWKAYRQQSKNSYLYKEKAKNVVKESYFGRMSQVVYHPYGSGIVTNNWLVNDDIDAVDLYGKPVNPLEIRNVFTPGSWVVAQVTPTLWDITTQDGGIPRRTKTYQLVINRVQLALKSTDDMERDHPEGSSSSVLKHGRDDDVQREESPPLAPAPKRTLLGAGTFTSSAVPGTKMPTFKKKYLVCYLLGDLISEGERTAVVGTAKSVRGAWVVAGRNSGGRGKCSMSVWPCCAQGGGGDGWRCLGESRMRSLGGIHGGKDRDPGGIEKKMHPLKINGKGGRRARRTSSSYGICAGRTPQVDAAMSYGGECDMSSDIIQRVEKFIVTDAPRTFKFGEGIG